MKCAACQAEVEADSVFCPKCGAKLEQFEAQGDTNEGNEDAASAEPEASEPGEGAEEAGPEPHQPTASERLMAEARKGQTEADSEGPTGWTEGGYSPKALNGRFLLTCIVSVLLLVLAGWLVWGQKWPGWLWYPSLIIIAGLWIWYACVRIYRVWTIKYQLTAHQFYHEEGIFRRVRDVIEVIDIDDLKLERTLWDRVINGGVGTVKIVSADQSDPDLNLIGLDEPDVVFQSLDDARRKERAARGLKSV